DGAALAVVPDVEVRGRLDARELAATADRARQADDLIRVHGAVRAPLPRVGILRVEQHLRDRVDAERLAWLRLTADVDDEAADVRRIGRERAFPSSAGAARAAEALDRQVAERLAAVLAD